MSAATHEIRRGGIIAAGAGSRLRAAGWATPKPLVPICGRPMIDHVLENFRAAALTRLSIIFNAQGADACRDWLAENAADFDLDIVAETTPSSFASFRIIARRLAGERAVISTVDAWIPGRGFADFVAAAATMPPEAVVLGVTGRVDDEKPLWLTLDAPDGAVRALGGSSGSHVTAGLYVLPAAPCFPENTDFARLRDYLRWLVDSGRPVHGVPIADVIDLDRVDDIAAAEHAASTDTDTISRHA